MSPVVAPSVLVDWSADGTFTGPEDDITCRVASDPGVTLDQGMDASQVGRPPMVNAGEWEVYNDDAKYSPESATSPLYQLIVPGRDVQIVGAWGTHQVYRQHTKYRTHQPYRGFVKQSLARGIVSEMSMTTHLGKRRVRFDILGLLTRLRGRLVSIPIQQNIRTDQAIALVLDAAAWPATTRALSPGDTTLSYWWVDEQDAFDVIAQLVASEGAGSACYEDGDGVIHFENRGYRSVTYRSMTPQSAFFDQPGTSAITYRSHNVYRGHRPYRGRISGLWFTELTYTPNFQQIVNRATYTARRRALQPLGTVWEYGQISTLSAGQQVTLIARPSDPFLNAVTPAENVDYVVSPPGGVSVVLSYTSGAVAFIVVTAGGAGATVSGVSGSNGLQLRAQSLALASESVVVSNVDTTSSVARFGTRSLDVAGWPEIDFAIAQAVCNSVVTRRQLQRAQVAITIRDADTPHVEQILRRTVSDRVTIVDSSSGLHADCWVEHRSVALGPGPGISAIFICEKVQEIAGVVWDDALRAKWDLDTARWAD